ncbi:glycoside hydrolase family 13 protein [Actinomyces mediterranea]|uniref:glycoside hydrolase family 13 protein n=1 Tax=Actinomyces mediterranea TaxID=1871028 RepID=UPI000970BA3A|nr:glycoside hydrolase family 13 protein [Actinomyces mediterranea]
MTTPGWLHDAVFYQIFPDRFANGDRSNDPSGVVPWNSEPTRDNFFGGDLRGIVEHLDHIRELGANALYLTPIFQADTNHRYDAEDYFSIDRRLGTDSDFVEFVNEAHRRGMRIVLDAVLNHCGRTHPAFQDVIANEADSRYVNWFYVEEFPISSAPTPNYRTCSGCEYLPKWNVHNSEVRDHHLSVARHWIKRGIDGWRLDVPYFINKNFWRRFREVVKGIDEELYIVAEEWRSPEEWLTGDTADGTMNYTLRDLILGFTADESLNAHEFVQGLETLQVSIPEGFHHGMLNLLGSHDTERLLTRHHGNIEAELLALDLMYGCQGAPMIYYGDEVGMTGGNDPGCRAGMLWNRDEWCHEIHYRVSELGRLRREMVALRRGTQRAYAWDTDTVIIVRESARQSVALVIHRGKGTVFNTIECGLGSTSEWKDKRGSMPVDGGFLIDGPGSVILVKE